MIKGDQTKQRMIGVTAELLRKKGYFATGLNEIIAESKAPKGSLYFHFPGGKDELATAALRYIGDAWRDHVVGALAGVPPNPARDIALVCDLLAAELARSGFAHGCPLATVTLETAADHEPLRALSAEHFHGLEDMIAARLTAGGLAAAQAGTLATLVLSSLEGAMILARAYHDTAPLHRVAAALGTVVAAPAAAPRTPPRRRPAR